MSMVSIGVDSDCEVFGFKVTKSDAYLIRGTAIALYNGLSWVMRRIVDSVPDETLQRIGKVLGNVKNAKSIVFGSAWKNPIVSSTLLFWILSAVLLLILTTLIFVRKIFFTKKGKKLTALSMMWPTFSFMSCVLISTIGMLIYSNTLDHIQVGIEMLPQQLNTTTSDVNVFMSLVNESATCLYKKENDELHIELDALVGKIARNIETFKKDLNVTRLNNIIVLISLLNLDAENIKRISYGVVGKSTYEIYKVVEAVEEVAGYLSSLKSILVGFQVPVNDMFSKLDENIKVIQIAKEKFFVELDNYMKIFGEVVQFVDRETTKSQRQLVDILNEKEYLQNVHDILRYSLLIPFTLVFLSVIGLFGILVSWTFYDSRDRHDTQRSRRGALCEVTASAINSAGYTAMIIGALLCIMAAFCFAIAFCSMFICMGLFEYDDFRVFNAISNLRYSANARGGKIPYTLYDSFKNCTDGYTFFEFLDTSGVAVGNALPQILVIQRHDISPILQNFSIDEQVLPSINSAIHFLRERDNDLKDRLSKIVPQRNSSTPSTEVITFASKFHEHLLDLIDELRKIEDALLEFKQKNIQEQFTLATLFYEISLRTKIVGAVSIITDSLVNNSPKCQHLYKIWMEFGKYVCRWISAPIQALWLACTICFIGSLAIYRSFFKTARFLQDFAQSIRCQYQARRRRRRKYDYVKENMKMDVEEVKDSQSSKEMPTPAKHSQDSDEMLKPFGYESSIKIAKNGSQNAATYSKEAISEKGSTSIREKQKHSAR